MTLPFFLRICLLRKAGRLPPQHVNQHSAK